MCDEDDEVIETSDAEELEELRLIREARQNLLRETRHKPELGSPRKRRKINHERTSSSPIPSTHHLLFSSQEYPPATSSVISSPAPSHDPFKSYPTTDDEATRQESPRMPVEEPPMHSEPLDHGSESPDPLLLASQANIITESPQMSVSRSPTNKPILEITEESSFPSPSQRDNIARTPSPRSRSLEVFVSPEVPIPLSPLRQNDSPETQMNEVENAIPLQAMHSPRPFNHDSPLSPYASLFTSPPQSPRESPAAESPEKGSSPEPSSPSSSPPARAETPLPAIPTSPAASSPPPVIPPEAPRYSLRQRQPAQINPYEWDRRMYQYKLKDNPEAIVKMRAEQDRAQRARHNPEDGSESQAYVPPPSLPERRRRSRSRTEEQEPEAPREDDILPPLSDSEDEEIREVRREARRVALARKAQEEEKRKALLKRRREERDRARGPRPYPELEVEAPDNEMQTNQGEDLISDTVQVEVDEADNGIAPATTDDDDNNDTSSNVNPPPRRPADPDSDQFDEELKQTLGRMYPRSMFSKLAKKSLNTRKAAKKASRSARRASMTPAPNSDDQAGVRPGQAKKSRISHNPRRVQDIRGDSESSEEDQPVLSSFRASEQPRSISPPQRAVKPEADDSVLELSSESASENSDIDDDIVFLETRTSQERTPGRRATPRRIRREQPGIDFMLSRAAVIAKSNRTRRGNTGSGGSSNRHRVGRTLKVVTRGARGFGGHQTVLDFPKAKRMTGTGSNRAKGLARPRQDSPDSELEDAGRHHHVVVPLNAAQERDQRRREQAKRRRRRMQGNGVYIFRAPNTHVVNGRECQAEVAVDFVDEDFHRALTPIVMPTFTPAAPRRRRRKHPLREVADPSNMINGVEAGEHEQDPEAEPRHDVPPCPDLLEAGFSFGEHSCLRRGWLDDLLSATRPQTSYTKPVAHDALDFHLEPDMGVERFTSALPRLYGRLTQWIVEPPDPFLGQQTDTWAMLLYSVGQHASWLLESTFGETARLKSVVLDTVTRLLSALEDDSAPSASIDSPVLLVSWFTVEMMFRIGGRFTEALDPSDKMSTATNNAFSLLVQYLWEYGLDAALDGLAKLREDPTLQTTALEASQLWVCLIHLVNQVMPGEAQAGMKHPIWKLAYQHVSQSLRQSDMSVDNSERVWHSIFALCALSQFSTTGTTTSSPNLGACWTFPTLALKHIRLAEDANSERSLNFDSVLQRDKYIAVVVSRCFQLRSRWGWSLDHARDLFRMLASIFQSRKFVNLLHEEAEYPDFVWDSPLNTLNEYRPTDTAYVLFLKLIAQAIQSDPRGVAAPMSKQYLSLVLPSASLAFPASSEPTLAQMSMLYNRYCANFLIMCLDPSSYESQMAAMRRTVSFANAHSTTQKIIILGLRYFGRFTLKDHLPFDECLRWLDDIVTALKPPENEIVSQEHTVTIMFAIGAIKKLLDVYPTLAKKEYPHGELLALADRLGTETFLLQSPLVMYQALLPCYQSFLLARRACNPPPRVPIKDSESQNEFAEWDLDIDMSDPTTLAALDGVGVGVELQGMRSDKTLSAIPRKVFYRIVRVFIQSLKKVSAEPLKENAQIFQDAKLAMETLAGFVDVISAGDASNYNWRSKTAEASYMRHANEELEGFLRYCFALELLKCNYHYYMDCMEFCVESVIWSLAGVDDGELELVDLVLPINNVIGSHPLLESLDSAEEETLRIGYFRKLMENLTPLVSNDTYVGYLIIGFRRLQKISQDASKRSERHLELCKSVGRMFLGNRALAQHPRFESSGYTSWFTRLLEA